MNQSSVSLSADKYTWDHGLYKDYCEFETAGLQLLLQCKLWITKYETSYVYVDIML